MHVEQLRDLKLSEDNCDALDVSYLIFDRFSAPARMQLLRKNVKACWLNKLTTNFWFIDVGSSSVNAR